MREEYVKNYIQQLLNTSESEKEEAEIQTSMILLVVYAAGLTQTPFPLEKIGKKLNIEKELPAQFHVLVANLAIKKSGIEQRTNDMRVIDCLDRNMKKSLEDFKNYNQPL